MQVKVPHTAFFFDYGQRQAALITECGIKNPYQDNEFMKFKALWDTGAMGSVISPKLVESLELMPTGKVLLRGIHDEEVVNTYIIEIVLPNNVVIRGLSASESKLTESTDVLIGMDIIGMGDFAICGGGRFFSYCVPPFEKPINFVEKSEKVNKRAIRKNRRG